MIFSSLRSGKSFANNAASLAAPPSLFAALATLLSRFLFDRLRYSIVE